MKTYKVTIRKNVAKAIKKLPKATIKAVLSKIKALYTDPRPEGCKKLIGTENLWRIRSGDYRIVYSIEDEQLMVEVVRVRHRKEVYE